LWADLFVTPWTEGVKWVIIGILMMCGRSKS